MEVFQEAVHLRKSDTVIHPHFQWVEAIGTIMFTQNKHINTPSENT